MSVRLTNMPTLSPQIDDELNGQARQRFMKKPAF